MNLKTRENRARVAAQAQGLQALRVKKPLWNTGESAGWILLAPDCRVVLGLDDRHLAPVNLSQVEDYLDGCRTGDEDDDEDAELAA